MTQRVPAPVQPFFVRYMANPEPADALRSFIVSLLQLEVYRANFTLRDDASTFEPTLIHRKALKAAEARLMKVSDEDIRDFDQATAQHHWLMLLGYRVSAERRLRVNRINALVQVASERLGVPITEAKTWSNKGLFHRYTETALRDEWDYEGLRFRQMEDKVHA